MACEGLWLSLGYCAIAHLLPKLNLLFYNAFLPFMQHRLRTVCPLFPIARAGPVIQGHSFLEAFSYSYAWIASSPAMAAG